jgi:predicted ArsR family transcriptional regulator
MDEFDYRVLAEALAGRARTPRRGRGGPRSRLVDAIMVLLLSKPMRAAEIAQVLGLESKYVSSYLSYWKVRGFVDYDKGFWYLTPLGEDYAHEVVERLKSALEDEYARLARSLLSQHAPISRAINNNAGRQDGRRRESSKSFIAAKSNIDDNKRVDRLEQVTCVLRLLRDKLSEDEFEVISTILAHYARWGSTYLYADQLQERLQADQRWLFSKLRSLQTKNLVYIYADPRLGIRVGLSRAMKEALDSCS